MRGHWLGGTRKLNHHWQSGEKSGATSLILYWPNTGVSGTYNRAPYIFGWVSGRAQLFIEIPVSTKYGQVAIHINEQTKYPYWGGSDVNTYGVLSEDPVTPSYGSTLYYADTIEQTQGTSGIYSFNADQIKSMTPRNQTDISNLLTLKSISNNTILEWRQDGTTGGQYIHTSDIVFSVDTALLDQVKQNTFDFGNWLFIHFSMYMDYTNSGVSSYAQSDLQIHGEGYITYD